MAELRKRKNASESREPTPAPIVDVKESKPKAFPQESTAISSLVLLLLTSLGVITRFWRIQDPAEVVFDEVHFGKFASYYLRRTYYFDVHPPLAKMMLAGMGWLAGYDGHFEFDNIGDDYIFHKVPFVTLRSLPAGLGALSVSLVYLILRESGFPILTAAFGAALVLLDNALIAQTRLILLDSMLLFFMLVTILSYIKFYKLRHNEFSGKWWFWLLMTGVNMSMTCSVKMVGLLLVATIGCAVLYDLWNLLDIKRGLTMEHFLKHFFARALALIVIPFVLYLFWFWVHFTILNISGPGDPFMSPAFQETLKGNSMQLESLEIRYGYNITLKHKDTKVYLHSHLEHYPLRYEDGRISSAGQQVTGYTHKDPNNYWRIKRVDYWGERAKDEDEDDDECEDEVCEEVEDMDEEEEGDFVRNGDIIQLEHVKTHSNLLTHDVASPLMPTNQEVTTWPLDDDSRLNDTYFELVIDGSPKGAIWRSQASLIKLIHMPTRVAVWTHTKALPDWAFNQQEVNGNKNSLEKSNIWVAEEIMGKNATEINLHKLKDPKQLSFLTKFWELQRAMLSHNSGLTKPHPYQSAPINWPFLIRGISFWTQNDERRQIYLLGNPFGWWSAIGSLAVFSGVMLADTLARRRGVDPIEPAVRTRLIHSTGFFFLAWFFHYIPFFLMGRSLFLHHYLPALIMNYLIYATVFQFMFLQGVDSPVSPGAPRRRASRTIKTWISWVAAIILIGLQAEVFWYFVPITYGNVGLDVDGVLGRQWLKTWDYHFAK